MADVTPLTDDELIARVRAKPKESWLIVQNEAFVRGTDIDFVAMLFARIDRVEGDRDRLRAMAERAHGIVKDAPIIGRATQITLLAMIDLALSPSGDTPAGEGVDRDS